ncbi:MULTISPECIES: MarR family winged helix-turn-helix transcriptional regulator [unclassified Streptomyces]|uniref:MarR family winged helix-turn-helix transcriptional regulator n=1 Tax=unclassified Streptomyces TaxID=2593676 RepID=UPI001902CE19|nr:MarR family transcriptional regulator [Streptomyces sp. HSG2]
MAGRTHYEELIRQFSSLGAVRRELGRALPPECPGGSATALVLLERHGAMHMSRLAELLVVDLSVASRHVGHLVEHGWIARSPDPADRRSRILRLTPAGRAQLTELSERAGRLFADRLGDWSDEEVDQLSHLMARLRASFDDGRTCAAGRLPARSEDHPDTAPNPDQAPSSTL